MTIVQCPLLHRLYFFPTDASAMVKKSSGKLEKVKKGHLKEYGKSSGN